MSSDGNLDLRKLYYPKEGYFTEDGKKKMPDQLGDYAEKVAQINDYFNNSN